MKGEKELWRAINALRTSRGSYGQLAENLEILRSTDPDAYEDFCGQFDGLDVIDVVLQLEC